MELDELHVDELGAGEIGQGVPVAGVFPGVRGDLVGPADATGGKDHRPGREDQRPAVRPPVAERATNPVGPGQQRRDRALHVDVDARRHDPVLEGPDHLQPGAVADVGQARVGVTAERPLEDPAVARPVEHGAPALQLTDPVRRLLCVELGHPRIVQELAADHRVAEVGLPGVLLGDVGQRRRDATLGHDRVGLAEQRLADDADAGTRRLGLDRRAQPGAAGADHEDVVRVGLEVVRHGPPAR
jgi:hypothetical protein